MLSVTLSVEDWEVLASTGEASPARDRLQDQLMLLAPKKILVYFNRKEFLVNPVGLDRLNSIKMSDVILYKGETWVIDTRSIVPMHKYFEFEMQSIRGEKPTVNLDEILCSQPQK